MTFRPAAKSFWVRSATGVLLLSRISPFSISPGQRQPAGGKKLPLRHKNVEPKPEFGHED